MALEVEDSDEGKSRPKPPGVSEGKPIAEADMAPKVNLSTCVCPISSLCRRRRPTRTLLPFPPTPTPPEAAAAAAAATIAAAEAEEEREEEGARTSERPKLSRIS